MKNNDEKTYTWWYFFKKSHFVYCLAFIILFLYFVAPAALIFFVLEYVFDIQNEKLAIGIGSLVSILLATFVYQVVFKREYINPLKEKIEHLEEKIKELQR